MRRLRLVLPCLVLFASTAPASDEMPLQGVLLSLQPGDTACSAEIEVRGEVQVLMAIFEICEQGEAWIGRPVRLAWTQAQVLAADCNGDMDCGRIDRVNLSDRMQLDPQAPDCAPSEVLAFSLRDRRQAGRFVASPALAAVNKLQTPVH